MLQHRDHREHLLMSGHLNRLYGIVRGLLSTTVSMLKTNQSACLVTVKVAGHQQMLTMIMMLTVITMLKQKSTNFDTIYLRNGLTDPSQILQKLK